MTLMGQIVFHNTHSDATPTSQKLRAVFRHLERNGFSLRDFLVEAFKSDDELVKDRVGKFYRWEGPSALVKIWSERLSKDRLKQFHNAIID
ncbi:hypothetical protein B0O80DRAFT_463323 [Mortierella sp. GBAus27b]|nr:hypothetical protein B0O80DRAFT_463323 [Mortierella sp. GBAus27b]